MEEAARKTFELENEVEEEILKFDEDENQEWFSKRPWTKDPRYFKQVRISVTALIKMVNHAKSGGDLEIMGYMQGKVKENTFYILDAIPLPIVGTETRVNAGAEALEYLSKHLEFCEETGRLENCCGWYHSHPGYGPWLSGIDVNTQALNQQISEPWLAVVIDPHRTISAGKVDLGCFRTFPEGYVNEDMTTDSGIPLDKIADFGAHADKYYQIPHSIFKSELDQTMFEFLWNQYWV
jgi:COP9 signalosome complex subunit 5